MDEFNFDQTLSCGCTVKGVVMFDGTGEVSVDVRECDHACKGAKP